MTEPPLRCHAHGTETRLTCARCEAPICPRCLKRTAVGLRCRDCAASTHSPQARSRRRPLWPAGLGLVLLGVLVAVLAIDPFDDGQRPPSQHPEVSLDGETASELQGALAELVDGAAGGTVAWVDTGDEQLGVAAGHADRRSGQELAGDEAFPIATVTEMVTATVALQLVEEGRLELDAPVAAVVPDQTARFTHGDDVTVRHLLANTSGLAEFMTERFNAELTDRTSIADGVLTASCPPPDQRMDPLGAAADQPPRFEPGAQHDYSHTDEVLLRQVVEATTGKPLAQTYRDRVFAPLDMDRTWMPCVEEPRAEIARGYAAADHTPYAEVDAEILDLTDLEKPLAPAASGLVSTGQDLATFARALVTGQLFDEDATLETMREPQAPGSGQSYGLGLEVEQGVIGHAGGRPGYDALVRYYPATDVVVVALSSQPRTPHQAPASRLAESDIMTALTTDASG